MILEPLGNRVLVEMKLDDDYNREADGAVKTKSGLYIPQAAAEKEQPTTGYVRAIGEGKAHKVGETEIPIKVKIGDEVLVNKYGGMEVKVDGKTMKIFMADDISCIVRRGEEKKKK